MTIGITTKSELKDPHHYLHKSIELLKKAGVKVDLCPGTCRLVPGHKPALDFHKPYDILIVFGGDGTLLRTLQFMRNFECPVLAINMGRLGFFSEGVGRDYKKIIEKLLKKKYHLDQRMLLRCTVMRKDKRVFSKRSLNEVTIARDALARMVALKTTVDDLKLTTYVADGLIVGTPTGSTGYSLSAGGPVISPSVDSIILTPISPHSFTQKPIVLPPSSAVKIHISTSEDRVYLTMDGQHGFHLKDNDLVKIKRSSKSLKLIRFTKNSYFQTLRKKLHWGSDLAGR
ncbi:MAG: NAD(+)/NADH kinase [bacterium]|nr:NAD(+)/NADH kinase [bacterium]